MSHDGNTKYKQLSEQQEYMSEATKLLLKSCHWSSTPMRQLDIEYLLSCFAERDSNNYAGKCSVGEREGRVFSSMVHSRCFGLSHGIGRSGQIDEHQPKAVGSTGVYRLANKLIDQVVEVYMDDLKPTESILIPITVPVGLGLCGLVATCSGKSKMVVVTDNADNETSKLAVSMSFRSDLVTYSTSRQHWYSLLETDDLTRTVVLISIFQSANACQWTSDVIKGCNERGIPCLLDQSWPLHCPFIGDTADCLLVMCAGRICGTPLGASIFVSTGPKSQMILDDVKSSYPGRASISPALDIMITLLSLGRNQYTTLVQERTERLTDMDSRLAGKHRQRFWMNGPLACCEGSAEEAKGEISGKLASSSLLLCRTSCTLSVWISLGLPVEEFAIIETLLDDTLKRSFQDMRKY